MAYNENDHPRDTTGKYTRKNNPTKPCELPDTTTDAAYTIPRFTRMNIWGTPDEIDIERVDIRNSNMTEFNWLYVQADDCLFDGSDMSYSKWISLECTNCSMNQVNGDRSDYRGSRFDQCSMTDSSYKESNLGNVTFTDCDLKGTVMTDAHIGENAKFERCDLRRTDLRGTGLSRRDPRLVDCRVDRTTVFFDNIHTVR